MPLQPSNQQKLEIQPSRNFTSWLSEQGCSLGFTTYQAGKLFLVGVRPDGAYSAFERTFQRCMGMWSDGQSIWLSSQYQLWRLENVLRQGQSDNGYDRLYVPQVGYTTGDIDVHDLAVDSTGKVVFVSTLFGCLATVSEKYSFEPLWLPSFLGKLSAEDRCHLNGLALDEGKPKYVSACSQSDVVDGWREHRVGGGCVIDVVSDEIVCEALCMPHSPRVYQGKLWLLNSGTGYFGYIDLARGAFEPVAFCPGYARGLNFVGNYAVVGLSKCRADRTFAGLPLDKNLAVRKAGTRCGVFVINLHTGDVAHWLQLEGSIQELYDVVVLPGVARPKALGFKTNEIGSTIWLEQDGRSTRWTAKDS